MNKKIKYLLFFITLLFLILYSSNCSMKNTSLEKVKEIDTVSYKIEEFEKKEKETEYERLRLKEMNISERVVEEMESQPVEKTTPSDKGSLIYKIDSIFRIGRVSRVEARIIKKTFQQTPQYILEMFHKSTNGKIKKDEIKVGEVMNMELISIHPNAFEISKISSDNQHVDKDVIAEWIWGVEPLKIGKYNLILKATIKKDNYNEDKIVFDKKINVLNKEKIGYSYQIKHGESLKSYEDNLLSIKIKKDVTSMFRWGGEGEVFIQIEDEEKYKVIKISDNYIISDKKDEYEYKWKIKPIEPIDTIHLNFLIENDYENLKFGFKKTYVENNIIHRFNNFVDNALQRWYFIFSVFLIPLFLSLKKLIYKKKQRK